MGEKRKLLAALDAYKGKDAKAERQKKLRKQAERKKKAKQEDEIATEISTNGKGDGNVEFNAVEDNDAVDGEGWETEESERAPAAVCVDAQPTAGYAHY